VNSPNPFSRNTSLSFSVPGGTGSGGAAASATVRLTIYDVSGRVVRKLVQTSFPVGSYTVSWDGRDEGGSRVASGIYFARVSAGAQAVTRKMLLVR
jgi:flagellar hook assembly protein FlgD